MSGEEFDLYDVEEISDVPTTEYVSDAADAFLRAALDYISWTGDKECTGENPLDLGAHSWAPVGHWDAFIRKAYTDPADSPEAQVETALGSPRAIEIVNLLGMDAETFGDRLYHSVNGTGVGFWSMNFNRPEYQELDDLVQYHPWEIGYSYDQENDPDGNNVTLAVYS